MADEQVDPRQQALTDALRAEEVPQLYANGFMSGVGNADIVIVLQLNLKPIAVLNVSYTMAKTLHVKLGEVISDFEKKTQRQIMTTTDVDVALQRKD